MAAATAAIAAVSFVSAYTQSVAMGEQAKQEELIAQNNASMAKIRIEQIKKQGDQEIAKFRGQGAQLKGTQKAAIAASGVDINYGSALQTQEQTEMLLMEDEQRMKNNIALQAWGFKTESVNASLQGKYKAMALRNQAQGTVLGGAINSAAMVYGGWGGGKMKAPSGGYGDIQPATSAYESSYD